MVRVAYLGPSGTYSQEAATKAFGDHEPVFCNSLAGVVASVAEGKVEHAVLPIENSTNGTVSLAVAALLQHAAPPAVSIFGEVEVRIRHQLYSNVADLSQITVVYSHPQVWGQSDAWLRRNLPKAKRVDCSSTSDAVVRALAPNAGPVAALGGPLTSTAEPKVPDCADDPRNTTRFLLLKPAQTVAPKAGLKRYWATVTADWATIVPAIAGLSPLFVAQVPAPEPWEYTYLVELEKLPPPSWTVLGTLDAPQSHL